MTAYPVQEFDLQLASGNVRVRRVGSPDAPLVLFVPGLSAHLHGFDYVVEKLAPLDRQLVAIDLRGRGRSDVTPSGSYGLDAHCRDVFEVAAQLGAQRFDLVGWSMGALIAILAANVGSHRLRRVALIDHAGDMDGSTVEKIIKGLARLDVTVDARADYVGLMRDASGIAPWSPFWDRYFDYELAPRGDGFKPTTSRSACLEDLSDLQRRDWDALWKALSMPVLLVRCLRPIGGGFIVPEAVRDRLREAVPQLDVVEVDQDHYTVMTCEQAARAIGHFLA
jgi:pimeloyl-ACP methyl ester carboxylesterase